MNRRFPWVQLVLFVLIGVGCTAYVGVQLAGSPIGPSTMSVTVHMTDAGGIAAASQVTYRGVQVGTVRSVELDPDGTDTLVVLNIQKSQRIPADTRAVIDMDSPLAIQHLDLEPPDDHPPYLHEGSVIAANNTGRPLPLETLLVSFMRFADSINTNDLNTVTTALSTGLAGAGPQLTQLMDNADTLMRALAKNQPTLLDLANNTNTLLGSADGAANSLPQLASALRDLADQVRAHVPDIDNILDTAPDLTNELVPLLRQNQQAVTALLGNMVTTAQIVSARTPALNEALIAVPSTLGKLAGIVHGNTADFDLVATQGPVCYYDTPRRSPADTGPRAPELGWHCAGDQPNLEQRGAQNAPRPGDEATATTYDPATGEITDPSGHTFQLGPDGGQSSVLGPASWTSLLLQGVQ